MKISDIGLRSFLLEMLPSFAAAGRVACRIQDDIVRNGKRNGDAKDTGDRFTEALTDADILCESAIGTELLARFEDASFYGEEHERDRVSAYFPKDAPYLVTLDPIDGTLYFQDGLPIFSMIMTVCVGMRIEAALVYVPREERAYLAVRGEGAWTADAGRGPERFVLDPAGSTLLLGASWRDRKDALEAAGFEVITPSIDYDGSKDWRKTSLNILTGEIAGMAYPVCQLIDGGAIAFIAVQAGGKDNGPVYDPETKLAKPVIVGATPERYDAIASIIGL
jgi:fructose-1,6-bisphosphatase/inositol monophosphatase family enzyme